MAGQAGLTDFFESFLKKESIFLDKKALQQNYAPKVIPHRQNQINQLAGILAPALRKEKPSNMFCYGKTGTGKTVVTQYVLQKLIESAASRTIPLKTIYVNCKLKKIADTEYRIIAELARALGKAIPSTGLPTDEVYNLFLTAIDETEQTIIFVLDEIDRLVDRAGDEILYNLTRINSSLKKSQVSIVGISNDTRFLDNIDPRVKSSLGEEEIIFAPYNAMELKEILEERAKLAFKTDILAEGVLEKCSAYAAREHGDARRAIDLLRVASELAERENSSRITPEHIDKAEDRIEKDRVLEIVAVQPKQSQAVFMAILEMPATSNKIETGEVYDKYKEICGVAGFGPLTQRRVS
ncbi:MAG: orc1/cdc6 family replication initiation protein, partial [Nanoarchaeota archaeon]